MLCSGEEGWWQSVWLRTVRSPWSKHTVQRNPEWPHRCFLRKSLSFQPQWHKFLFKKAFHLVNTIAWPLTYVIPIFAITHICTHIFLSFFFFKQGPRKLPKINKQTMTEKNCLYYKYFHISTSKCLFCTEMFLWHFYKYNNRLQTMNWCQTQSHRNVWIFFFSLETNEQVHSWWSWCRC